MKLSKVAGRPILEVWGREFDLAAVGALAGSVGLALWNAHGAWVILQGVLLCVTIGEVLDSLIDAVVERVREDKFRGYNEPSS